MTSHLRLERMSLRSVDIFLFSREVTTTLNHLFNRHVLYGFDDKTAFGWYIEKENPALTPVLSRRKLLTPRANCLVSIHHVTPVPPVIHHVTPVPPVQNKN